MSHDRRPLPMPGGTDLGLTMAAGTVRPGAAYVMTDEARDTLYITALATDVAGRFTRPMGRDSDKRYEDCHAGNDAGWSRRQRAAATKLGTLWRSALPLRGMPMAYGDAGRAGGACLSDDQIADAQGAWDEYCVAMADVERRCSERHANALRMAIIYLEPSPLWRAGLVREGLAHLADYWRLR